MKKSLALFLVLLCLAAGGLVGMTVWVNQNEESVEVTQTTLRGDPAAAQGLTITAHNQMYDHLLWDTEFSAQDAGQSQTQFQFSMQRKRWISSSVWVPSLRLPSFRGGMSSTGALDLEQESVEWWSGMMIAPAAIAQARDMGPNQVKTVTLNLADQYSRYPVSIEEGSYYPRDDEKMAEVQKRQDAIRDFFNIPVPQGIQLTYTFTANEAGEVTDINCDSQQDVAWESTVIPGEEGCFYILDSYVSPEWQAQGIIPLDFSHIRDGYGVYFIPYEAEQQTVRVDRTRDLDVEQIRTVYVVPQGERTVGLYEDQEGSLLLYTVAGETWYLNVLSGDGRQLLQRLELGDLGSGVYMADPLADPLEGEDYLLLFFNEYQLVLLTRDETGYVLKHILQMPEDAKWDSVGKEQTAQWDGRRLVLLERDGAYQENIGYRLTVWQEGELTYQGEYVLSFQKDNATQLYSSDLVLAIDENAMELNG